MTNFPEEKVGGYAIEIFGIVKSCVAILVLSQKFSVIKRLNQKILGNKWDCSQFGENLCSFNCESN